MKKIIKTNFYRSNLNQFNTGFTLIEVLITMLILAIGVLGIAALQFKALKYNHDALIRNQISFLANDIADLIKLDQGSSNIGNYAINQKLVNPPHQCGNSVVLRRNLPGCSNINANNTSPEVCNYETNSPLNNVQCWWNMASVSLPPGSNVKLTLNNTSGTIDNLYFLTFTWLDKEGSPHAVSYSFR